MTQLRQVRATTLADKLAYWISHRINVLFRCGPGVCIDPEVSAAFGKTGLQWRALSAYHVDFEQILSDDSVEAILIVGIDLAPKKFRRAVQQMFGVPPNRKMVWATVTVLDEDDFDTETDNVVKVEGFNVVVDVPRLNKWE
jgi:hypothetical protein